MRALLDTNLFLSYLIKPEVQSPTVQILEAVVENRLQLIYPEALLEEIRITAGREKFRRYFSLSDLDTLIETITVLGEPIPKIEEPIPRLTRDIKDDYLLAYAVVGQADYLVTGDQDLLVHHPFEGIAIVTARTLLDSIG